MLWAVFMFSGSREMGKPFCCTQPQSTTKAHIWTAMRSLIMLLAACSSKDAFMCSVGKAASLLTVSDTDNIDKDRR